MKTPAQLASPASRRYQGVVAVQRAGAGPAEDGPVGLPAGVPDRPEAQPARHRRRAAAVPPAEALLLLEQRHPDRLQHRPRRWSTRSSRATLSRACGGSGRSGRIRPIASPSSARPAAGPPASAHGSSTPNGHTSRAGEVGRGTPAGRSPRPGSRPGRPAGRPAQQEAPLRPGLPGRRPSPRTPPSGRVHRAAGGSRRGRRWRRGRRGPARSRGPRRELLQRPGVAVRVAERHE